MIKKIYITLLFLLFVQLADAQVWSPWTISSMGDTTLDVADTVTGSAGGDSLVYTYYNYTVGQVFDQYSGNPTLSLGFCQGSTVRIPGNIDTLGLAYANDLKQRLFFTKNIFINSEWQSENPDIYFELHQLRDDGTWEKKVYARKFKQLEGIAAMKCVGTFENGIPYYRTFSDSIDVILGPDQLRDFRLLAFAVGHRDTIIKQGLEDLVTLPYYQAVDFRIAEQTLHNLTITWIDNSAYAESYHIYRNGLFIGEAISGRSGETTFKDHYVFDSGETMRPGESYNYKIIAQNSVFPEFSDSSLFAQDLSAVTPDIGLTSVLIGSNFHVSWDNSGMQEELYDMLTLYRGDEIIYKNNQMTDEFIDTLPVFGQKQDYRLVLSHEGNYLVEFIHHSDILPPNGIARGKVLTLEKQLPVYPVMVKATTIKEGDTSQVSAQTDKFGRFEIPGIFYGRESLITLSIDNDTAEIEILLNEDLPVSEMNEIYVPEGNITTENAPVITSMISYPVDSINVVELSFECDDRVNTLFQVFRNEELLSITESTTYTDLEGLPGVNYRYVVIPFKHLDNKEYLVGERLFSDVEFPKITVPEIILTTNDDKGFVTISVHHYAENLDGLMIYRDSLLWKITGNPWTGDDMMAQPGKDYEYSAQAFRVVNDTFAMSGINREVIKYPEIPLCTNLSSSNEDGFLELAWDFSGNESVYNFDGFRIYRDSNLIGFVLKGKHSLYDYHGIPGGSHLYSVTSYLQVEDNIYESEMVSRTFQVPGLSAPHYISATKYDDHSFNDQVLITWATDYQDTYDGYIIIRDGGENGDESFEIPSPYQLSFIDMVNLTDLNYKMGFFENLIKKGNAEVEYKLLAYADHDGKRFYSDTVRKSYTFILQDTSGVFAPVHFRASDNTSGNITLDWEYPEFMTSTFLLFCNSDFIAELPVGTRRYQDIDVEPGSRYIYHMRAVFEGDSSIFVADAGSISSGHLIHGKVLDQNFQPVVDVKLDITIYYSDLSHYKNNTLSNASGYFIFPELSLHDFTDIHISAYGVNSQFVNNPVILNAQDWDGSPIYVEFVDATHYKLHQQDDVATPVACYGKADGGSGTLFLTWGASNANFSYFEISRGLRNIGKIEKGQPMVLIDSSAAPGYTQVYTAQAFWEMEDDSPAVSPLVPFIAEAPYLAAVENLEVIPFEEKNRIEVSWSHPTNNVDGYYIYRNRERIGTCLQIPFIFKDTTGVPNHPYSYGVTAFWLNSDETEFESEIIEKEAEFPEVYDPTNINLKQKNNSIEISWECGALNFDGFLVYRDSIVIDTMPHDRFYYRDFGGYSGKYHRFGIAAFRDMGANVISSRIREKAYVFPELVRIDYVTTDSTDRFISIGWTYGSEEDSLAKAIDGFKIFRNSNPEPYTVLLADKRTAYSLTDYAVDPETDYAYSIFAFKEHMLGYMESPAVSVEISTEKLHMPQNFIVEPSTEDGYYRLTWDYYDRLDIDGFYIIDLSGGNNVTLSGTDRIFIDTKGETGNYSIQAVKNGKYSDPVTYYSNIPISHSVSYTLGASKGTSSNVKLLLGGLTGGQTYYIKRDGELIATREIPVGASVYVIYDSDVDPGKRYTYSLFEAEQARITSVGWAKPDGVVSGFVRTPETAGVPLVTITYTGRYYEADSNYTYFTDTTRTDESGAYVFNQVTYGASTEYLVKAYRKGHGFSQDIKSVTLSENRFQVNCDFTDTSAILLSGTVKHEDLNKGWEGVPVILTAIKSGGYQESETSCTDKKGFYSFNIEPDNPNILQYQVTAISETDSLDKVYGFKNSNVIFSTDSLRKFDRVTIVDFTDTLTSNLHIQVVNGGGKGIFKPFKFKLNNRDYRYEKITISGPYGAKNLRMPAVPYTIELVGVTNNELDNELYGTYFKGKNENIDLSLNKFITADTCVFVYHTPAHIEILYSNMELPPCIGDYVVKQDKYYLVDFGVTETHGGEEVPVNSGKIIIRNGASGKYLDTVDYVPSGRFESHYFMGGEPELVEPYRKYLHATFIDDHGQKLGQLSFPVIVEGKKSLGGTDIFINPEDYGDQSTAHIPMYVLRDPPGDGSSSFLESGVTINRSLELDEEEAYYRGFKTEGKVIVAGVAGAYWEADLKTGESRGTSTEYELSAASSQRLETSSDALDGQGDKSLVGRQADIVVGMDMLFTYTIQYDLSIKDCEIIRTTTRTYKPTDIKSTWIYTRNQIEAKIREYSNSRDILTKESPGGGGIRSLQVLADNWQGVIDYIDQSGHPGEWINHYADQLKMRRDDLNQLYEKADDAGDKVIEWVSVRNYYRSLATDLDDILTGMNELIEYLESGPPVSSGEGYDFGSADALNWYREALEKINEFEESKVIRFSDLDETKKNFFALRRIYEASIEIGDEIFGDNLSYPMPKNYTFGGGTSFESTSENSISKSTGYSQSFTSENSAGGGYAMELEAAAEVGWWAAYFETKVFKMEAQIGGYGGWDASTSATDSEGRDSTVTSGFTLSDDDPGDQFSVNVFPSLDPAQTAFFALVGGRSSCPEEEGTIYRDMPTLSVENPLGEVIVSNFQEGLNESQEAVFPLKIGNLNPFGEDREYVLSVDPASNRYNATILANGQPLNAQTYSLSPSEPVFVDLSIMRRPGIFEADSIEVSISSACEGNISEKVYLSAFWERPCTPVAITEPSDHWVSNRYNDELLVKVSDFDPDCKVLGAMILECRRGGHNKWEQIAEVSVDSLRSFVHATSLIYTKPTFIFTWYVNDPRVIWDDGDYQLRVIADCNALGGGQVYSNIVSGTIDRKNIRLAGPPEPMSGILTMGGKVKARFTEEVSDFEFRILTVEGEAAAGLEMIIDGQEVLLIGADHTWRNLHHGERFTIEMRNVEDYWGNSTSNTTDSLITWDFRVWNAPVYVIRSSYDVSVPLNGKLIYGDLISNLIACENTYFGQMASYNITSSSPASLSISAPQSISLPGYDSLHVTISGNRDVGVYHDSLVIDNLVIEGSEYPDIVVYVNIQVVPELAPWELDAGQFESTMNIVANFALNDELSADPLDMIAVFVNNDIRGLAHIEEAGNDNWAAYITAGEKAGEELDALPLEFRIWDASAGIEYDGHPEEEIIFVSNTAVGTSLDPVILLVDSVSDKVSYRSLHSGWNYIAFTPSALNGDINEVLKSLSPNRESVIKSLTGFATYTTEHGWLSSDDAFGIDPLQGYMLYLTHDDDLRYPGPIDLEDTIIDISRGWNLLGYPFGQPGLLTEVMEISANSVSDLIKGEAPDGQLQFSDYSSSAWSGSLSMLHPMYAYMLKSEGSYAPKLIWHSTAGKKSGLSSDLKSLAESGHYVNPNEYEKNMTVIGVVELDGMESISSRDSLVVMHGDTVVGYCILKYRPEFNRYYASFMIYGNNTGDVLDVYVYNYDHNRRFKVAKHINFVENMALGSWGIPYKFTVSATSVQDNYNSGIPGLRAWIDNTRSICKVEFHANDYAELQFGIYNLLGQKLIVVEYHSHPGRNYLEIPLNDEKFSSGVYFLRSSRGPSGAIKLFYAD
jgi:hypothetical protein